MNVQAAESLARKLLIEHGYGNIPLKWTRSIHKFGTAEFRAYGPYMLHLSKPMVEVNPESEVRDVILHEIAHFIAGLKAGHNWQWKMACRKIGARPERCWSVAKTTPAPSKYSLVCPNCQKRSPRARRTTKEWACTQCCKKYNFGRFTKEYVMKLEVNH